MWEFQSVKKYDCERPWSYRFDDRNFLIVSVIAISKYLNLYDDMDK